MFPPYEDSSEDEPKMDIPHDHETLGERMSSIRRERGQPRPQRHMATTHRVGQAVVSDSDEESGERNVLGSRQQTTRQMMMTVTLVVTGARSSETTGLYLSCSLPFWHQLTKGERGKIEMLLLSSSSFIGSNSERTL
jgi:hypothetical protein